jgi:hypothetical protein
MRRIRPFLLVLSVLALTGCARTLFTRDQGQTTQFDTYELMRGDYVPRTVPDVFGTPQPALRARLGSRD